MKNNLRLNRTFIRWSRSYFLIFAAAMAVMGIVTVRYTRLLSRNLDNNNELRLQLTRGQIDELVQDFRNVTAKENRNDTVKLLKKESDYAAVDRYYLYELTRDIAEDIRAVGLTGDYLLYFPSMDLVVGNVYYGQSESYYETHLTGESYSYETWHELMMGEYRTTGIVTGDGRLFLIRPLDNSAKGTARVNAILSVATGQTLQGSDLRDGERIAVVNRNDRSVIALDGTITEEEAESLLEHTLEDRSEERNLRFSDKGNVIASTASAYENWDYAVMVDRSSYLSELNTVSLLAGGMILLYLIVSLIIIIRTSVRQYGQLRKVVSRLGRQEDAGESDALSYIDRSVDRLVRQNREHSDEISRQREAISRELFHQLITAHGAADLYDQDMFRGAGITIGDDECGVLLAYRMEDLEQEERLITMSWFILRNVTEEQLEDHGLSFVCFPEGSREQLYLIWSDSEPEELTEAVVQVETLVRRFVGHNYEIRYRSGLSDPHHGVRGIHRSYGEVRTVFESQQNEELVRYSEINLLPEDTLLKYPIDLENRLTAAVRRGETDAAIDETRQLLELNRMNYLAPEAMQFLVGKIMTSIIREAGHLSADALIMSQQNEVLASCNAGDADAMIAKLYALIGTVCQRIRDRQTIEQNEEKKAQGEAIVRYVEENYADASLSVNGIAEAFGQQAPYISRLFKEYTGDTPSHYIHRVRLERAKELLLSGERIEGIVEQCGYGSQRTFLRIFKQYEGITPGQYHKLHDADAVTEDDTVNKKEAMDINE